MNDRPTKTEIIEREVNALVELGFEAYRGPGYREGDVTVRTMTEKRTNLGLTFETTVTVYGKVFTDFAAAKEYAKNETVAALTKLAENRPAMVFDYDEGTTPVFDGWPGAKAPNRDTWEKIYDYLRRQYGPTTEAAVRNYVLAYSNTSDAGVPFNFVLDINYNPKVEVVA